MCPNKCFFSFVLSILVFIGAPAVADTSDAEGLLDKVETNLLVDPGLARQIISQAEKIITEDDLESHKPRLLNLRAHLFILSYDLNNAWRTVEEAKALAIAQDNKLQLAEAIRRQGIINSLLGFNAEAVDLLTESLRLHNELKSPYLLNNIHAIGNIYNSSEAWVDSLIETGELLIEKATAEQHFMFIEQGYHFVVAGLIKKGELQQAVEISEKAIRTTGDKKSVLQVMRLQAASAYFELGEYDQSLQHLNVYIDSVQKRNNPLEMVVALRLHADILVATGNKVEGEDKLLSALNIVNEVNYSPFQQMVLQDLADFYEQDNQPEKAIDYLRQYYKLKEQEFNNTQNQQLGFSRAQLEVEQKNQQITEQELSLKIASQENTFQLYVIVLSSFIIVLLLLFFTRSNQQKRKLQLYSEELQRATEAKSQFLARMSHEIRTPINAIIGLTKLSRKQKLTPQQQDVNLQQIEDSSLTLLGVINDILDFSKIEAGKMDIEQVSFELDKVIDQATRLQTLKAQEKGLELIQYIARDVPLNVIGDGLRLQQILNNLISNAVKFTKQGVISVSVNRKYSETGLLLEFSVKDTGIGLTEEQMSRLFDSFSQADESTTRQFGGTGLGLAICKQLAVLMGGKIWVESHPGQGATFSFTALLEEDSLTKSATVMSEAKLSELRVLVVDDIDLCRRAAAEALLRVNINPDLVESGFEAIEKIRLSVADNAPYDLILLDWQMPELDGIEVASMINQEFTRNKPKIVMLSAYDMKLLKELGDPIGIKSYLEKPIHNSNFINMIVELMNEDSAEVTVSPSSNDLNVPKDDSTPTLTGRKILLVEDNKLNRKVALGFLADTYADVSSAENGQEAVDMLKEKPDFYDVVFMDVQMPVMDGLTATQLIRQELNISIPIIAMTANAMQGDIDKCIAVGMNAHIPKPIDPDYMFDVLSEFVNSPKPLAKPKPNDTLLEQASQEEQSDLLRVNKSKAISKLKYNEKLYEGLIKDFIAMKQHLNEFVEAVECNDFDTANRIVHTYKSSLSYVGAFALEEMAIELEKEMHNQNDKFAPKTIESTREFCNLVTQLTARLETQYQFHNLDGAG